MPHPYGSAPPSASGTRHERHGADCPAAPELGTPGRRSRHPWRSSQPPRPKHGRSLFVAVVATVLALGLAALLTMNTVLAQDAFVLSSLQQRNAQLAVTEQALASQVAAQEDPTTPSRPRPRARHAPVRHRRCS